MRKNILRIINIILLAICLCGCGKTTNTIHEDVNQNIEITENIDSIESIPDGVTEVPFTMEGGTGKAYIESPAKLTTQDGISTLELVWSSVNYDYMIVDGIRYEPVSGGPDTGEVSVFEVPVNTLEEPLVILADTVAMGTPHEIEYTLYFNQTTAKEILTKDNTSYNYGIKLDYNNINFGNRVDLEYATQYRATYSDEGFYQIIIANKQNILVVPEGYATPDNIPKDMICLHQPLQNLYMVSTSSMDYLSAMDRLDMVAFCGLEADEWYVDGVADAMNLGTMKYAGKYSAPDFESLLDGRCDLAVENTMIYHKPEIMEQLQALSIPVIVEYSSYENDPLGKVEWIKLYGILAGDLDKANNLFDKCVQEVSAINHVNGGKTIAFFYVTQSGAVNVRRPSDYVAQMIDMAGGRYILADEVVEDDTALSTMNMQMEAFVDKAFDADILIYNATIAGEIKSIDELCAKSALFADFKAVKNGNVYCTGKNLFQESMSIGQMIVELNCIIEGQDESNLEYINHIY